MGKIALTVILVCSLLGAYWLGQARGAESFLVEAQAAYADYEDALAAAQREYDALLTSSNARMAELEMELIIEQDTREYWWREADQKAAEASRWKSLAGFFSGVAY